MTHAFNITISTNVESTLFLQNSTSSELEDCPPLRVYPILISAGLVAFAVIIGNSFVILAIAGGNSKFFRPMYWFIIYLSCSDLLVGFMLIWNFCLAGLFDIHNALSNFTVLQGVWVTSACMSMLGISLLSIDRYMQVVHRPLYARYFNPCSVGIAILLAVFVPIFIFLIAPIAFNWSCLDKCQCFQDKYMECRPFSECSLLIPPFTKSYILACLIFVSFLVPWPITMYSMIFVKARKATQVVHPRLKHRDFRLIQTLVAILVAFIITFVPCTVIMIKDYLTVYKDETLIDYALYVFLLTALNSLANPILYIWRIPAIRLSLQQKVCCICFKPKPRSGDSRITKTESKFQDGAAWKRETPPVSPDEKRRSFWFFRDFKFSPSLSEGSRCSSPDVVVKVKKKRTRANHLPSLHIPHLSVGSSETNKADIGLSPLVAPEEYKGSSFNLPVFNDEQIFKSSDVTNSAVVLLHGKESRDRENSSSSDGPD